jgi:hypothetical protein
LPTYLPADELQPQSGGPVFLTSGAAILARGLDTPIVQRPRGSPRALLRQSSGVGSQTRRRMGLMGAATVARTRSFDAQAICDHAGQAIFVAAVEIPLKPARGSRDLAAAPPSLVQHGQ